MDLTERVKAFRSRQRQALSWVLTAGRSPRVVVAMGDRLTLLLIGQVVARPEHLLAAVTSEQEAVSWIANEQPTQPSAAAGLAAEWQGLDPLVHLAVSTGDLGDSDDPLMRPFMELARQRRDRSASLRRATAAEKSPLAKLRH
jgi:hypothetical protein